MKLKKTLCFSFLKNNFAISTISISMTMSLTFFGVIVVAWDPFTCAAKTFRFFVTSHSRIWILAGVLWWFLRWYLHMHYYISLCCSNDNRDLNRMEDSREKLGSCKFAVKQSLNELAYISQRHRNRQLEFEKKILSEIVTSIDLEHVNKP